MDHGSKTPGTTVSIIDDNHWDRLKPEVLHCYASTEAALRPAHEANMLPYPVTLENGHVLDGVSFAPYDGAGKAWTQRQQQLLEGLHARRGDKRKAATVNEPVPTREQLTEKIRKNRWMNDDRDPALACDWSQLRDRPPLTPEEMQYFCDEMTHSVRVLATLFGCSHEETAKLHVDCWRRPEIERDYHSGRMQGGFLIGVFYDCDRHDYRDVTPRSEKPPSSVYWFMSEFESALDCVLDYNCTMNNESYRAYGSPEHRNGYYSGILSKSTDVLIPFAKVIAWLRPGLAVPLTIPEPYSSPVPGITDEQLHEQLGRAVPDSIDAQWAQQELSARNEGRRFVQMREKSRQLATQLQPQPLAERLRIALTNERIAPVQDEWGR